MGETVGDSERVEQEPLWFVAAVGGYEQKYGPYTDTVSFYWDAGFVVGFLAAKEYAPSDISIRTYEGDTLIEVT